MNSGQAGRRQMSSHDLTVYVSATYHDLYAYRSAAMAAVRKLGYRCLGMEEYTAQSALPVDRCTRDAAAADIYVGIFAWSYGYVPAGYPESITILEYRAAVAAGAEALIFLVDEEYPWLPGRVDQGAKKRLLDRFKAEVRTNSIVESFTTTDDLAARVTSAVARVGLRARLTNGSGDVDISSQELGDYQQWATEEFGTLQMTGLGLAGFNFPVNELYVPPKLTMRPPRLDSVISHPGDKDLSSPWELVNIESLTPVRNNRRGILIEGEPGSGKTTVLRKILCDTLLRGKLPFGQGSKAIPIYARLRNLNSELLRRPIYTYIQRELDDMAPGRFSADLAKRLWDRGDVTLLLDGLDEIATAEGRRTACEYILAQTRGLTSRNIFCIVTMRNAVLQDADLLCGYLAELEIRALDEEQVHLFLDRWFLCLQRAVSGPEPSRPAQEYWSRIRSDLINQIDHGDRGSRHLKSLISSPLMLTLLCVVAARGAEVPQSPADFYSECFRTLLGRWSTTKNIQPLITIDDAISLLIPLGYHLHEGGKREFSTYEFELLTRQSLAEVRRKLQASFGYMDVLDWLHRGAGVFTNFGGDKYGFSHLGLQEYLTARHAANDPRHRAQVAANFGEPWWREVVLLLVSFPQPHLFDDFMKMALTESSIAAHFDLFMECLDTAHAPDSDAFVRMLEDPAARPAAKVSVLRLFVGRDDPEILRVARSLVRHPDENAAALARTIMERAGGSPRSLEALPLQVSPVAGSRYVEPHTGLQFLYIPAGAFDMGTDDMTEAERPVHRVEISGLWMAETQVTNRQYELFLQATSHPEPAFWRDRRFLGPQMPVVGVNWHDSIDFCRWLSRTSGLPCTLPTEAQWEYSARGTDGRRYPWGNEPPDRSRACYWDETRPRRPEPVGSFPAGRGPFGVLDQAGNVWDWCLDVWNPQAYSQRTVQDVVDPVAFSGSSAMRVARGGTWWFSVEGLDARYRYRSPIDNRTDDIGIRVVLRV
jgi:formylglycine-generating enzyme required for sulfatase activity